MHMNHRHGRRTVITDRPKHLYCVLHVFLLLLLFSQYTYMHYCAQSAIKSTCSACVCLFVYTVIVSASLNFTDCDFILAFSNYNDVIMSAIASPITSLTIVYSTVYSDADQRKHPSSASLAFVLGIHRRPVNSPHKGPVAWKMFPFDDVIMLCEIKRYLSINGKALFWILNRRQPLNLN